MSREQLNEDADRILGAMGAEVAEHQEGESLVEEWSVDFYRKALEYGTMHRALGLRAQFVDIHRKLGKLQRAWWDGIDTENWREQPREIAMDMIGHLFLAIALIDREQDAVAPEQFRSKYAPSQAYEYGIKAAAQAIGIGKTDAMRGIDPEGFEITLGGDRARENCGDNSYETGLYCKRPIGHEGWHSSPSDFDGPTKSWANNG